MTIQTDMKVRNFHPGDLVPYEGNPRLMRENPDEPHMNAVRIVADSIEKYGFRQPIVVDENSVIIAGHTRHKASLLLGLESVPVVVAEGLSADEVREYRVADNKTAEWTGWDLHKLVEETQGLTDIPGFLDEEFAALHAVDLGSPDGGLGDNGDYPTPGGREVTPPSSDEYVQLSFFVRREFAADVKQRCESIIATFQAGMDAAE